MMFRKLISNLPFSPSLIDQLGFYSKRLKKEQATRRLGLILVVLTILIQSFTLLVPAKATLAASANDIVFGGGNKTQITHAFTTGCDSQNRCDIKAIYGAYGITATNLAQATSENIYSSTANNYWSIGRIQRDQNDVPHNIPGGPTIFARTLHGWSANTSWSALRIETTQGTRWVLTDCGNIVTKESQVAPTPQKTDIVVTKQISNQAPLKGQVVDFVINVKNISTVTALDIGVQDTAPAGVEFVGPTAGVVNPIRNSGLWATSQTFGLGAGQSREFTIKAKIVVDGPRGITNEACALSSTPDSNMSNNCGHASLLLRPVCRVAGRENLAADDSHCQPTTTTPAPPPSTPPPITPITPVTPVVPVTPTPCPYDRTLSIDSNQCVPPVEKCPFNQNWAKDDVRCKSCPITGKTNLAADNPECQVCAESQSTPEAKDISCLEQHKTARNITQQISNANGTKANPGDSIEYTLSIKNLSKTTRKAFVVEENIDDVLEYADIIDATGATYIQNPVRMLSWNPVDLKAGETISRTFLVKIKSPIPTTPASSSDPQSFDMRLLNTYGDTVEIDLPISPIKTVEHTVTILPSTGIGTNIFISTLLVMGATYFYFRSSLMLKEVKLVRNQFNYGMGV